MGEALLTVTIKGVSITDIGFVIFLKSELSEKVLPIFVGPVEAQAISLASMKKKNRRPLTHDLFKNTLEAAELVVNRVEIVDFKDETYFANLYIQKEKLYAKGSDKSIFVVDARPSDAIALALKYERPILLARNILETNGILLQPTDPEIHPIGENQSGQVTRRMNEQLGMYEKMLQEAIREERFEDASRIKQEIETLTGKLN